MFYWKDIKMKFGFRICAHCRPNLLSSREDGHQYKQRRPTPSLSIDLHTICEIFTKYVKYSLVLLSFLNLRMHLPDNSSVKESNWSCYYRKRADLADSGRTWHQISTRIWWVGLVSYQKVQFELSASIGHNGIYIKCIKLIP